VTNRPVTAIAACGDRHETGKGEPDTNCVVHAQDSEHPRVPQRRQT